MSSPSPFSLKTFLRSRLPGAAIAFFLTLALVAPAQEKPAAPAEPTTTPPPAAPPAAPAAAAPATPDTPPPATEAQPAPPLRRLDEPAVEQATDTPATPSPKTKKSRSQQIRERAEENRRRAEERAASYTGDAVANVFADSELEAGKRADTVVAVFGNVTSAGEVIDSVVAVFGDSRVTGPVREKAVTVFGNSYVNSRIGGQVVVVFGDLHLGPQAEIGREVVCVGGTVTRDPGAIIGGPVTNVLGQKVAWLRAWLRECFAKARPLAFGPNLGWAWGLAFAFLALYTLGALLFRSGAEKCLTTLETRPGFSVLTALLTMLITPVLTVLLVMTGVGIAVVPFIAAGMLAATLFGKMVILAWLGRRITRFFGEGPLSHIAVAVIVGGLIMMGLYTVPVLGFFLFKVVGWVGLGAVVYTMILGMKREKRPAPPPAGPTARPVPPVPPGPPPAPAAPTAPAAAAMSAGFVGSATAPVIDVVATPPASASANPDGSTGSMPAGASPFASEPAAEPPFIPPASSTPPPFTPPPVSEPSYAPPPRATTPVSAATLPRAGFWVRTGALALDGILIVMVVKMAENLFPHAWRLHDGPQAVFLALAIYGAAMWKTKGTTIGGVVCGLKVVRLDDRALDWPTAIVRALSCFLSFVVGGLGFIWVIFDADKQSWHDKIAGTTVVRVPKGTSLL